MYYEHVWHISDLHDRNQIGYGVVTQPLLQRRFPRDRANLVDYQGIAVRRGPHDELGAYIPPGARFVLDHERLLQSLRELLSNASRKNEAAVRDREQTGRRGEYRHRA